MRWRRDERNAGNGVARLGDDVVHLESGQLSTLTRLGSLCHLYLNLLGIHQIFSRHAEASAGNLFGLRTQRHAIHLRVVARIVLATLTRVRACAQFVHRQSQSLVSLDAQRAKTHRTRHEVLHDALHTLHLVDGCGLGGTPEAEEVAQEDGRFLLVHQRRPLLEFLVVAPSSGQLQFGNRLWVPSVPDAILAPRELALVL